MAVSGLAFLFDIIVDELKSFVQNKQFVIRSQFADVFSLVLKNPEPGERKKKRKKPKNKSKAKNAKNATENADSNNKSQKGQTVLFVGNIDILMGHMMQYPMEICLCPESDPTERVASTLIPWKSVFIEYLMNLYHEARPAPARVSAVHSVFDEATSKRMAALRLTIKLRITDHVNLNQYRLLSEKYPNTFLLVDADPTYIDQSTATKLCEGPGIIKTIYRSGKHKKKSSINKRNAKREATIAKHVEDRCQKTKQKTHAKNVDKCLLLNLTRSDADVAKPVKLDLFNSKSCTAVKQINLLDYIYGDPRGPFGNKTYTVGYFMVDNANSKSPSPASISPRTTESPHKTSSKSSTSLDPALTTTVKCDNLRCKYKRERPLLEKPDDRIMLDITSIKQSCCVTESIERKMEIIGVGNVEGQDPCYCACECTFGFERKTTYCQICGGYEKPGEDLEGKPQYLMPDPCPVFHKISKIKTGSTSGSESKKDTKKRSKSPDPGIEKDKKGKNDRFKFNYGYKAPQIGHSRCTLPCTGTLSNVPKSMGWLWTADNVPGLMVAQGWKPGAVSKCILRLLKRAKKRSAAVNNNAPTKKSKLKCGDKPTLVISKKDGEYTLQLQVTSESANNCIVYDPVVYKIASASNEAKVKRRETKAKRLIKDMMKEFNGPFHPDACQQTCLRSYKEAIGFLDDVPESLGDARSVSSGSPSDDGDESDASSLDLDWEIQFSPPNARANS